MKLSHAFGSALVTAAALLGTSAAYSQTAPLSDSLYINDPRVVPPGPIQIAVDEVNELGAVYGALPGFDPVSLDIVFAIQNGAHFVGLTEPFGVAAEPGELGLLVPCPLQPGQCVLSDIVVGFLDATGPHVGLYSDPHPVFNQLAAGGLPPGMVFLQEDGTIQDVNALLGFPGAVIQIGVQSDVVPLPAAAWLFGSALGLLGWSRRRSG